MPINPLIALQGRVPDIGQAFSNTLLNVQKLDALKQAREQAPIRQRLLEAQTGAAEAAIPTDIEQFNVRQKQLVSSVAGAARNILPDLQAGNIDRVRTTLQNRLVDLQGKGLPTRETEEGLALVDTNPNELIRQSQNAITLDEQILNRGRKPTSKAFAPVTIVNDKGEKRLVSPTIDVSTGKATLNPFDIPEGFHLSKETDEEKRTADVVSKEREAAAKITGKGQAERRQLQIDKGIEAADGFANIQRAIDLLDGIETGGIDSASLRAKQLFGIEGADEAELSNRMGKAVLSQLRATFGAAFTAKEGDSLARIEAGFGKSTKGNRRLLKQTKKIILRAANRGIRAARAQNDLDTVKDIEESLAFRLDVEPLEPSVIIKFNKQGQRIE